MIYILANDGEHLIYEESAVRKMLAEGALSPETLYWREGMPEWAPLSTLSAAGIATSSPSPDSLQTRPSRTYHFRKDPEPLTTTVKVMLAIYLIVSAVFLYGAIGQILFVYATHIDRDAARAHDLMMRIMGDSSFVVYIITSIPFLMWFYRANLNCHGFAHGLTVSPAMSVGSFFIPFINLVLPCLAMQEIWKVSTSPRNWKAVKPSVLVGFWWTFWLLTGFAGEATLFLPKVHDRESLWTTTACLISLETLKIFLSIIAFTMIHIITARQKALVDGTVVEETIIEDQSPLKSRSLPRSSNNW